MARSRNENLEIVLVAVQGDLDPGTEIAVPTDEEFPIGRSSKGLRLLDPLVSIQHAKISRDIRRGYVIHDLGSATGTWVDEECIKSDSRPIGIGTRLRFGETLFEVSTATRVPMWMKVVGGGAFGSIFMAILVFGFASLFMGAGAVPTIKLPVPVQAGKVELATLKVPVDFLRARGLHVSDLRVREITDHDYDGYDEVWLTLQDGRQFVITFEPGSTVEKPKWRVLGELPPGCVAPSGVGGNQFPPLECEGTQWLMDEDGYRLIRGEGVVVYYRECDPSKQPKPVHKPGPVRRDQPDEPPVIELGIEEQVVTDLAPDPNLSVGRFVLKNPEAMAAFFADRGITGPAHYVVCEDAFPGIVGQALREDGQIQKMSKGCIHELRLEGTECGDPVAFALTALGHQALIDDVRTFYAGNPDGLFMPPSRHEVVNPLVKRPGFLRGGVKLIGETRDAPGGGFDPVPDYHRTLDRHARQLLHLDARILPAPKAVTATVIQTGRSQMATGHGCVELEVNAGDFASHGWRRFNPFASFMDLTEIGCGNTHLIRTGYDVIGSGVYDGKIEGLDVRAVIETRSWGRGTDVVRARVTWRETPGPGF